MSDARWFESLPESWSEQPLFAVASERRDRNHGMREAHLLSLSYGRIIPKSIESSDGLLPASFETYQVVQPDDIVLRLTDLQNDQRSLRSGLVRERGIITSAYLAIQTRAVDPKFLAYQLRAIDQMKVFYSMGGGLRQSIGFSDLKRLPLALPSITEQRAIADYLDRETAQIDAFIAKNEELVALLIQRRRAAIDQVLLQAGASAATVPLKRAVGDVTVGIVITPARWYADAGVPALRSLNVRPGVISVDDLVYLTPEGDEVNRKSRLRAGDVVVVRTGQAGTAAVVPQELDGANAIDLLIVRPGAGVVPSFLAHFLNSGSTSRLIAHGSVGSIQGHFNVGSLRELPIPSIDLRAQLQAVGRLDELAATTDKALTTARRGIALARERRAALISAAVTGKIDVGVRV